MRSCRKADHDSCSQCYLALHLFHQFHSCLIICWACTIPVVVVMFLHLHLDAQTVTGGAVNLPSKHNGFTSLVSVPHRSMHLSKWTDLAAGQTSFTS